MLYVLDEPSIGLHPRDNARLLGTLQRLRDLGNTVIVVEHDGEAIAAADHLVDFGPGAGVHGGEIVAQGTPATSSPTPTVAHRAVPRRARGRSRCRPSGASARSGKALKIVGARENNLKNVDAEIPLGLFTCVTGVSRLAARRSLVNDMLYAAVARKLNTRACDPGAYDRIEGLEHLDKVIDIDQSPIGRTPRSNPATYTGVFDLIRELFAGLPEAQAARLPAGALLLQRQGRPLRGLRGRRRHQRSRCTSCPTSGSPATSARASATTARRWR